MNLIFELTIIITLATLLGFIAKLLKQPILVAYLAVGALLSYFGFFHNFDQEILKLFADLGIMFLLFLVGLEINFKSLRLVGKASIIIGLGQIVFTAIIGFFLATLLNFSYLHSLYIAVALTFSSTIIVVKLLSDKKDTQSLYGKISIGLLLVQDMVVIIILILLGSLHGGQNFEMTQIFWSLGKGLVLFLAVLLLGYKILPKIFSLISHSQEMLFLASTAWVFIVVSIVAKLGFSIEIAGFLAGLALANTSEHFQIANKIRPLRDFFVLLFFILLGSSFAVAPAAGIGWPIIIFSLFVLIGNPLIVLIIMGIMGYRKRTSFLTGVTVAQISEFSLIVAAMGLTVHHIDQRVVVLITGVGVITIVLSSYMIVYANQLFTLLSPVLSVFERKKISEKSLPDEAYRKPYVLIGFHRTGRSLAHNLKKEDLLVVDFDPEAVDHLQSAGLDYLLGDIADPEIFEKAVSGKTKLVISTSPDLHDNLTLITMVGKLKRKPRLIIRAETEHEAESLYHAGADYVIIPNLSAGHYLGKALGSDFKFQTLNQLKTRDLKIIRHNIGRHKV